MSAVKMGILPAYNLGRSLSQSSGIISEARINPRNEEALPGLPRCDAGPEAPSALRQPHLDEAPITDWSGESPCDGADQNVARYAMGGEGPCLIAV
jgi:hypothetical protein